MEVLSMIKFNLKKVMKEKKVTLKELSRDTGLSVNTLSLLSTGKSKGIQFDTLEKIIQSLKCNVKDLIVLEDGFRKLYLTDISVNKMRLFIFSEPNDNRIFNISCKYAEDEAEEREILLTIFFTKEFVEVAVSGVLPTEFLTSGKYYYKSANSGLIKEYITLEDYFILQILRTAYKKYDNLRKMFDFSNQKLSINLLPYTDVLYTTKFDNEDEFLNRNIIPAYEYLNNLVFFDEKIMKITFSFYNEEEISEDDL